MTPNSGNMEITWQCFTFNQLNTTQLYKILQLRTEVFVVEQNCVYMDMDGKDFQSFHFCGWHREKLAAYTRLLPPGVSYTDAASIGRVVNSPALRGKNIGRELMERSVEKCHHLFGKVQIKISAQLYLQRFYSSLGFKQISEVYLEDNIEHILMVLSGK